MRKLKLYLDTSVMSHLFVDDRPEKMEETNQFWEDVINGKYKVFISPIVLGELRNCQEPKRSQMFTKLDQVDYIVLEETKGVRELADEYITKGVLTEKSRADCLHIAFAVFYDCDIIVSWNFKHLVNFRTINKVKIVNATNNYREISIVNPTMLL